MLDFNLLICIYFLEIIETVERIRELKTKKDFKNAISTFRKPVAQCFQIRSGIAPKELVKYRKS